MGKGKKVEEGAGRPDLPGDGRGQGTRIGYARYRQTDKKIQRGEEGKGNWMGRTERMGKQETSG